MSAPPPSMGEVGIKPVRLSQVGAEKLKPHWEPFLFLVEAHPHFLKTL